MQPHIRSRLIYTSSSSSSSSNSNSNSSRRSSSTTAAEMPAAAAASAVKATATAKRAATAATAAAAVPWVIESAIACSSLGFSWQSLQRPLKASRRPKGTGGPWGAPVISSWGGPLAWMGLHSMGPPTGFAAAEGHPTGFAAAGGPPAGIRASKGKSGAPADSGWAPLRVLLDVCCGPHKQQQELQQQQKQKQQQPQQQQRGAPELLGGAAKVGREEGP